MGELDSDGWALVLACAGAAIAGVHVWVAILSAIFPAPALHL